MACSSLHKLQAKLQILSKSTNRLFEFLKHGYSSSAVSVAHLKKDKAFINGQWTAGQSGNSYNVYNPSTGDILGSVPDMTQKDAKAAIESARKAFDSWKRVSSRGKPLAEAVGEIAYSLDFLEWFGEECRRVYGDVIPSPAADKRVIVLKQPIGVAGMITPWNFPSAMITRKAGAAIAAGCTVVLRPAEDTPFCALALCDLAQEAGIPDGVFNVITSDRGNAAEIGRELCENPDVSKISFTGSTAVGKILLAQSSSTVKKLSLELGGNAPFIVFDSADVDLAVKGLMATKFRCSGQTCISANRILVQEGVYDQFMKALAEVVKSTLKVGDGLDPEVNQGPLINKQAVEKVDALVKQAIDEGAKVVLGGAQHSRGGNFYQPTVLGGINTNMSIAHSEIFGPVVTAIKFKTEAEAVAIANATPYGLASYFYTSDISQSWRVAEQLESGMVGVNDTMISGVQTTFGGIKESGLGTEGGKYGIDEYLEKKSICFGGM